MSSSRRRFLKAAGGSTLGGLLLGLPRGWVGSAYADDSPETRAERFGIIALTADPEKYARSFAVHGMS